MGCEASMVMDLFWYSYFGITKADAAKKVDKALSICVNRAVGALCIFANLISLIFQVDPNSVTEYIGYLCSGLAELFVITLLLFLVIEDLGIYCENV